MDDFVNTRAVDGVARMRATAGCLCLLTAAVLAPMPAAAQEALRLSLAGEDAARARREAITTLGYYNILIGPTAWRLSAGLGSEWNDNVYYSGSNQKSDFIIRPEAGMGLFWAVTEKNALTLKVAAGYSAYVENTGLSRYYIQPGSELSFDLYAGDVSINLHDRFSIIQDAYQDPTVAGNSGYSRLENALGTIALWDLNQAVVRIGYDHVNHVTLSGNNQVYPDGQQEVFFGSAGVNIANVALAGVELGGSLIDYQSTLTSGGVQWNAGTFCDAQVTEYLRARASVGYTRFTPDAGLFAFRFGDYDAVYFEVSAQNRLNQYISQTLAFGRSVTIAYYGSSVDSWYARWAANWKILQKTTLTTSLDYQYGKELRFIVEDFNWFGGGLSAAYPITRKLTGSLAYSGHWRDSNIPNRNYLLNTIGLHFTYAF